MAGGGLSTSAPPAGVEFEAKITPIVIISCIMAATGGLMFGYDVGISGGVTAMPDFLKKFFPVVYEKTQESKDSNYCKYDNQGLQLFTSSLYLAGLVSTFFASYTTRKLGRRLTMLIAGFFFIVGVVLNAAAQDLAMLIIGRILLGCGVGFANQAVPLFLSEIAPTRIRGGLNILFQLNVTIGILFANLVNYGTAKIKNDWGWRISLGLAGVPALLLTVGALIVTDTPNSLIERGRLDEGKDVLRKIRKESFDPLKFHVWMSTIEHSLQEWWKPFLSNVFTIILNFIAQSNKTRQKTFYIYILEIVYPSHTLS